MCTEIVLAGRSTFTAAFDSATYTLVSLISPEGQVTVTIGCRSNADLFTLTAYLDQMIREFPPCGKIMGNVSVSFGPATGQLLVELYSAPATVWPTDETLEIESISMESCPSPSEPTPWWVYLIIAFFTALVAAAVVNCYINMRDY